jgi:deoxyribodipyrimidine photolyase
MWLFCNELNMDWRLGAAYFESQLIDYDVCSNWAIGLIWQELEMIQGSTVISIFKTSE